MQKLYAAEEEEAECDMSDDESIGVTGEEAKNEEQEGQVDLSRHKKFPTYSSESLKQYQKDEIKETIKVLEQERDILSKNSNMGAIAEYRKKEQEYLAR
jgi:structural maintenance of chromosome 4